MPDASLIVNGSATEHKGWTDISVTRSLEQFAHTFDLGFTERWSEHQEPVPIREGDTCVLKLDDKQITAGYVDDCSIDYDANSHTLKVAGRSITSDLVDCTAVHKKGQFKKPTLRTIAENLCAPFGIAVKVSEGLSLGDSFSSFTLEDGETVYTAIERACRMRGILLTTSPTGALLFTSIGANKTETVIEYGKNVLKGGRAASWKDLFSQYTVKSQAPGTDNIFGHAVSQAKAVAYNKLVSRYRPITVHSEHATTGSQLKKRAQWEANVRAARSRRLRYTLDGWENKEGIWTHNTLVRVIDPLLEVDANLLVISVRQTKDENGATTDVELTDPDAMKPEPIAPKKSKKHNSFFGTAQ